MVNIKTKFPRGINSDQVISARETADDARAPGPGLKLGEMDIASSKHQASSQTKTSLSSESLKHQATSVKPQAASFKRQATSCKLSDPCTTVQEY